LPWKILCPICQDLMQFRLYRISVVLSQLNHDIHKKQIANIIHRKCFEKRHTLKERQHQHASNLKLVRDAITLIDRCEERGISAFMNTG
jgi:hypothetical protein